ncbi:hypothetical protein BDN67DRAFT_911527, partial [Paxillus ammoniavirescens]
DITHHNLQILTRELLYVVELADTITNGDFGHIEDILSNLAMMFCGTGSNNYCSEILHFIHNLKRVWTPEFACVLHISICFYYNIMVSTDMLLSTGTSCETTCLST